MVAFLFNTVIYVPLLLCLCILIACLRIFIVPAGTLRLPRLRFFYAFSSVVRQIPGYNSQRRARHSLFQKFLCCFMCCSFLSFCVLYVCKCVLYYCHRVFVCKCVLYYCHRVFVCKCILYYCHRVANHLQLTTIYHIVSKTVIVLEKSS